MTGEKSAVIIGAGIGGITTAIFLAKNGYKVDIYEKNSSPGGRCGQIIRDGHRFDLGATMLMMPGVYREVFKSLEIPLFESGTVIPLEIIFDLYMMVFERIDIKKGRFTTEELNPTPEETKESVYRKIVSFYK